MSDDKYRQAIENWIVSMEKWYKLNSESEWLRKELIRLAVRQMHTSLAILGLPNNWESPSKFTIDDFKLPEAK